MKCFTPDRARDRASRHQKAMVHTTVRWSMITAVWILFTRFHWSKERVNVFLRRYDEQSDMIAPLSERFVPYDERSRAGYTFDEIRQEVGLKIDLRNSRQSGGKVERELGYLQDCVIKWVLDVLLNTLRNKFGWSDSMCYKFISAYNSQIPNLDRPDEDYNEKVQELQRNYDYEFEVKCI